MFAANILKHRIMEDYLLEKIRGMSRQRKDAKVVPSAVLMSEIQNAMIADAKDMLNHLCKEGVLTFHRTLNDVSFEPKNI